ncbi:hypothetical protein LTR37_009959 [Vermiconidia calcicola]|uniref:Uncharacterized protein n=1 Tax=Vermiconidia calcicola TaxID=1690605 RepID=A0ACC3N7W3_9PEZI|nr:hypothetical protein LTR37_009959 [Vermiconidia calcicola]
MSFSPGRGIGITRCIVVFLVIFGLYVSRNTWLPTNYRQPPSDPNTYTPPIPHTDSEQRIHQDDSPENLSTPAPKTCAEVPGADNVMVMLKTGATELYQKLPTHFVTTFKCVPHFMIFSDLAQEFADYPVYDALESISKDFRENHGDFELYRKLQQYQREGQDMSKLQGTGSWNLDKWKFLPMIHKAFTTAGDNIEWFLIMEADTSLSWTNLLQWLRTMDPNEPYYLGAQNVIAGTTFAHGGSGVLISRKAAESLEAIRAEKGQAIWDAEWEELTSKACCGDEIIARAFLTADVELTPAWPLIQGETVASIDWTENHWCTPPVTWHHVSPIEIDSLWQFESDWIEEYGWDTPYLFRDVFAHFIDRHVTVNRAKWHNLSNDRKLASAELATFQEEVANHLQEAYEQQAVESADACAELCTRSIDFECMQWMFSPGRCYLGKDVRFGRSDERELDHWISGWMHERLQGFRERMEGCEVRWSGS